MSKWAIPGTCTLALAGLTSLASAQSVTVGGSRLAGMANAGLALPVDYGNTGQRNPAMFAHLPRTFKLISPYVGGELQGFSTSDLRNLSNLSPNGGLDPNLVSKLAMDYSDGNKELGAYAGIGFDLGGFAFTAPAGAVLVSDPNAAMQAWSASGANGTPPVGARLDAYGYGYFSYDVGYGVTTKTKIGALDIGAQLDYGHSYYSHLVAVGQGNNNPVLVAPSTDMPTNRNYLYEQSVGLDLGLHLAQAKSPMHYALVVQNAVEPTLGYQIITPTDGTTDVNPFRRQVSVGTAWMQKGNALAIDVQDIGNHAGYSAIRAGFDTHLGAIGLRAGYDTRGGPAVGLTVLGINFAIARQNALSLSYGLSF